MFIALNETDERIEIDNADPQKQYFCPICREPVIIRAKDSLAVRTHFAHKRRTQCLDDWSHDMSDWHYDWQQCFPKECREVVIENNGEKHRADVFIDDTVIEFQYSHITGEEFAKRNRFYISCGYKVVWVFDATDKIKNEYGDSIDPMRCWNNTLFWKSPRSEFAVTIPRNVTIYLQYKSPVSNEQYKNQLFDLMIRIKKITPEEFSFYQTYPRYILPVNFLKEYGADLPCLSISEILYPERIHEKTKPQPEESQPQATAQNSKGYEKVKSRVLNLGRIWIKHPWQK